MALLRNCMLKTTWSPAQAAACRTLALLSADADVLLHHVAGPNGEEYCWWQCTVKGGREGRDIDAITLAQGVEALGAGEIMLNCIDRDGTNSVRAPGRLPFPLDEKALQTPDVICCRRCVV